MFFLLMKSLSTSSTAFNYCIMAVVILRLQRGAMLTSRDSIGFLEDP